MPHLPVRAGDEDGEYNLVIRMSGKLKNQIIDICEANGTSLNNWALGVFYGAVRDGRGLPPAPEPVAPPPGTIEQIRAYLAGERLIMPCGKSKCDIQLELVGRLEFCSTCGVRTR
jgi:hypothetical protein